MEVWMIIVGLATTIVILVSLLNNANRRISELESSKSSLSVKYGKMSEQFMPFLENYPYDQQNFRFLGSPVDGVQFNEDDVVFVEFKMGSSQLSSNQKRIRELVENGKVSFETFKMR